MIINELITNSFQHAFKSLDKGQIDILVNISEDFCTISYHDNGPGYDKESVNSDSLGTMIIGALAEEIKAETTVTSTGKFEYTIKFPL